MRAAPQGSGARRSVGLAAIALAVAAGPLVAERWLPGPGKAPALSAPEAAAGAMSRAPDAGPAAARPVARSVPPRSGERPIFTDDAEPLSRGCDPSASWPETEGAFYERFLATWRAGGDARRRLEERSPDVLRSAGGGAEKVALLRALRDVESPMSPELLELALRELPDVSEPRGVSVPAFVVRHLDRAGGISDAERAVLERAVHNLQDSLAPNTRGRALRVLIATADDAQRLALTSLIQYETDPLVRAMGEQALRSTRESTTLVAEGSW